MAIVPSLSVLDPFCLILPRSHVTWQHVIYLPLAHQHVAFPSRLLAILRLLPSLLSPSLLSTSLPDDWWSRLCCPYQACALPTVQRRDGNSHLSVVFVLFSTHNAKISHIRTVVQVTVRNISPRPRATLECRISIPICVFI